MAIDKKQLRKELAQKHKEMIELQASLDQSKYQKQIDAFITVIRYSNKLIDLIKAHNMNADDVRLLAEKISINISPIYKNFEADITKNQQKRARSNALRKQRRATKTDVAKKDFIDELFESVTSETVDTSSHVSTENTVVTTDTMDEAAVRQY